MECCGQLVVYKNGAIFERLIPSAFSLKILKITLEARREKIAQSFPRHSLSIL